MDRVMNRVRIEHPAIRLWESDGGGWDSPYEREREYIDAQREIYNIIDIEIKLKEEKRYLHDLVRKAKK